MSAERLSAAFKTNTTDPLLDVQRTRLFASFRESGPVYVISNCYWESFISILA